MPTTKDGITIIQPANAPIEQLFKRNYRSKVINGLKIESWTICERSLKVSLDDIKQWVNDMAKQDNGKTLDKTDGGKR